MSWSLGRDAWLILFCTSTTTIHGCIASLDSLRIGKGRLLGTTTDRHISPLRCGIVRSGLLLLLVLHIRHLCLKKEKGNGP
jgi:hypothetical protein